MRLALGVTRAVALAALSLTGCAPTLHGGGEPTHFDTTFKACARENIAFALIPDFGATGDFHRTKCMKQRGWTKTLPGVNSWAWTGPGAIRYLYRFKDDIDLLALACPAGKHCQPVTMASAPAEWTAWTFEAYPDSEANRLDVIIVGDEALCERVRLADLALGVTSRLCRGPRYFKRPGAPDGAAIRPPASPTTAPTAEPTWATRE